MTGGTPTTQETSIWFRWREITHWIPKSPIIPLFLFVWENHPSCLHGLQSKLDPSSDLWRWQPRWRLGWLATLGHTTPGSRYDPVNKGSVDFQASGGLDMFRDIVCIYIYTYVYIYIRIFFCIYIIYSWVVDFRTCSEVGSLFWLVNNPIETGRPDPHSPQDGGLRLQPKRRRGFSRLCRLDWNICRIQWSFESFPNKTGVNQMVFPCFSHSFLSWTSSGSLENCRSAAFQVALPVDVDLDQASAKGKHWSTDLQLDGFNMFKWFW